MLVVILDMLAFIFALGSTLLSYKIYEIIPFKTLVWPIFGFGSLSCLRLVFVLNDFNLICINKDLIVGYGAAVTGLLLIGLFFLYKAIKEYINGPPEE